MVLYIVAGVMASCQMDESGLRLTSTVGISAACGEHMLRMCNEAA
jgi:hypothetical protein